eukprot:5339930-Amphidinium_carterae.1
MSISGSTRGNLFCGGQLLRKLDTKSKSLHAGRNFLQEIPNLSFFPLSLKDRALKDNVMRRAKTFLAESARRVFAESPGSTCTHGLKGGAIESSLNAVKVWPPLDHVSHNVAVAFSDHEVVYIIPGDFSARGAKASRRRPPPRLYLGHVPELRCLVRPLPLFGRGLALGLRAGGLASWLAGSGRTPVLPVPALLMPGAL